MECKNCIEYKRCKDSFVSWIFFIIGLIATIAIRAVTILSNINPVYAKIAWYFGVFGFLLFFIYKFRVNQSRSDLIDKHNIMQKLIQKNQLTDEDYNFVSSIFCALRSKKERINYIFIFALSAIALILAIYLDFIR